MNRVKKIEVITTDHNKEHITMQEISSTVSFSPSFSFYASGNGNLVEAAIKAVRESQSYYSFDDVEFEFETSPLREESFFHFPTTTTFKNSTGEDDVAAKNLFYGGWNLSSPSESNSSSESDDSEDLSPRRYYCFWSPSPARGDSKKSKSSSAPKRCRIKEFLRRSQSDGAVSTSSASKRCSFKDLLRLSHSHGGSSRGVGSPKTPSGSGSPAVKGKSKTASYKPEVDKRRKSYLPDRQDLIGVFTGMSRFRH